jgi:GAF domain-containing protein
MNEPSKSLPDIFRVLGQINSSLDLDSTLVAACRVAVELVGASHSGLVLFDENQETGVVKAEFPDSTAVGMKIQLAGVPLEETLINKREPIIVPDVATEQLLGNVRDILLSLNIQSILIVPIISKNGVLGSFSLDQIGNKRAFSSEDAELCKMLAAQLATAIDNSRLYKKSEQRGMQLEALQRVTTLVNEQLERADLPLLITQYAVKLLNTVSGGIYEYDADIEILTLISDFSRPQYLGKTIKIGEGMAGRLVKNGNPFLAVNDYNIWEGRASAYSMENGFGAVLAVPLRRREHIIGVLYVDDIAGRSFVFDEIQLLILFANTVSIALDNAKLLEETRASREALKSFYEASNIPISSGDPKGVLEEIVEEVIVAAGASGGSLILIDESEQVQQVIKKSSNQGEHSENVVRPNGLSMKVMRSGEPLILTDLVSYEDEVNPIMIEEGIVAALCFPLSWKAKRIGVMWLHYDEPRVFPKFELEALQLYFNQAAIAYDGARRMDEADRIRLAVESLTATTDVEGTLIGIVSHARDLFGADTVAVCSYDSEKNRFIAEESKAFGIPLTTWEEFLKVGLRSKGTVYTVLNKVWVGVNDIHDPETASFLGRSTKRLLEKISARSFQGVALKIGDEALGILYLNYNRLMAFNDEQKQLAQTFANHAALALKKARLLERLGRAKSAANSVAQAVASKRLDETLKIITAGIRTALDCDAVALFVYDPRTQTLQHPPTMIGVRGIQLATRYNHVTRDSLVYSMLNRDSLYITEDVESDPILGLRRFAKDEEIKSCVVIPLMALKRRVGVMFVNYRQPHHFLKDELEDISLFTNQAAVAIWNAQLSESQHKKLSELKALVDLSTALLSATTLEEILDRAVNIAAHALRTPFSNIVLPNKNGDLIFAAAKGWKGIEVGITRLARGKGSQTGLVIESKRTVKVDDFTKPASEIPFRVPHVVFENNIVSSIGVPMFDKGNVVGALLVHTASKRHFTSDEETLLRLIANQTAIAIKNAQQSESLDRKRHQIHAVSEAGNVLVEGSAVKFESVLAEILHQAVAAVATTYEEETIFGEIWLYDESADELTCQCIHCSREFPKLGARVGEKINLKSFDLLGRRLGIVGRTVRTKQPQVVRNVKIDPDYIEWDTNVISEITVPLFDAGALIGVLNIESDQPLIFDSDDPHILNVLGRLAVIARSIELRRQREETTRQYKLLAESSVAFASAGDEDEALIAIFVALEKSGFEDILLSLYDPVSRQIRGHTALGKWARIGDVRKLICELDSTDVRADVLLNKRAVLIQGTKSNGHFANHGLEAVGIVSQVIIPLALEEELIGTLQIAVDADYSTESDKQFILQAFSSHLSLAISRIRNLLKAIELTDQVVAGSRFIVAETLSGMALHSLGHKLDDITTKLEQDLEQKDVRENRFLFKRLTGWLNELGLIEKDLREALQFVKNAGKDTDYRESDLHPEVQRTIDMWINLIKTSKCVTRAKLDALNSHCRIGPHAFREILSVLIINSVQAHAKKIEIRSYNERNVQVHPNDVIASAFCLEFADDGEGLSTNNAEEIFDASYSTKHQKFGTGLGLFIARRLARNGGGYLEVVDAGPSAKGTTFRLTLPCKASAQKDD